MIRTFFGSPGAGKTTLAVKMAMKKKKYYDNVYLNFEHTIPGTYVCSLDEIGEWTFPDDSYIAVDEAGIEFNNRAYKALPKPAIAWFKKHRHYRCDIAIFSQSWEDMDITLRRLSDQLWYLYRFGPFTLSRRVYKRVTVNKETEQIIDGYRMASMLWLLIWPLQLEGGLFEPKFKLTYRPFYYQYFDSYSKDNIPVKLHKPVPDVKEIKRSTIVLQSFIRPFKKLAARFSKLFRKFKKK